MSDTPPTLGQEPWGNDLNAYLASLATRLDVLEAKPEYVYNSYPYKFSASAPPAGATEVRLDNVNAALATLINIRKLDLDGADRSQVLHLVAPGGRVRLNDWDNAAVYHRFSVTGATTEDATNVQIPVAWEVGSGTLPTAGQAKINVGLLVILTL